MSAPNISSPLELPRSRGPLIDKAKEIVSQCRASIGTRSSYYTELDALAETGRSDGTRSIINLLHFHLDRLAAHLYSPSMLHFTFETDFEYPPAMLLKLRQAGKTLTRNWQKDNTDMLFGQGVESALRYGSCLIKQWAELSSQDGAPNYARSLVMPWQFAVYREDVEELHKQPAFVETSLLTLPEVWRRIYAQPDAHHLFERIKSHSQRDSAGNNFYGFAHQVLSTSQISTGIDSSLRPMSGGLVNLNNSPNYALSGPQLGVPTYAFHELWVWGEHDYETIQYIEPDILIYPTHKRGNLLAPNLQPYTVIRPNASTNFFWGRSELADLIELQQWLATTADDSKRLLGLQIDKILAFNNDEGITDEKYGQFRNAGYINVAAGTEIKDLTPSFPPEVLPVLEKIEQLIDKVGGFGNVLDGNGAPGVRSGNHAQSLIKTASPTLRDRSLLVERQCAEAGDNRYNIMRAKDATTYWTSAEHALETSFIMGDLPEDAMAVVDSHSASPIFADDHMDQVAGAAKLGWIDGESGIELSSLPNKDLLISRYKEKQKEQQAILAALKKEDPEAYAKVISHGGHK